MFKGLNKLFASLGSVKAMEKLSATSDNESLVQPVDGDKIGQSKDGQLFVAYQEMQGYLFMETLFVANKNIKSFSGAQLFFKSANGDFTLSSDSKEIECEFSNELNRFVSEITFDILEEQITRITARDLESVTFQSRKKKIEMDMVLKIA